MKEYNVKDSWIKDFLTVAYLPISLNQTAGPSTVLKAMEEVNRKQRSCSSCLYFEEWRDFAAVHEWSIGFVQP